MRYTFLISYLKLYSCSVKKSRGELITGILFCIPVDGPIHEEGL